MNFERFDDLKNGILELDDLRDEVFETLERGFKEGYYDHYKSYEGTFEITFPGYFNNQFVDNQFAVTLHCYLLVPNGRYKTWVGGTLMEAVEKAREEIQQWLNDEEQWMEDEMGVSE